MKKSIVVLIGICIVASLVLAWAVFVKPEPAPPVPPPPPVNGDDTSDWKTYRNEEFGFEIKYPEDWKVIVGEHEPRWHETVLGKVVISGSIEDFFYAPLSITIRSNEEKLSIKEWYKKNYPKGDVSRLQNVKFNGIDGMEFSNWPDSPDSIGSFYFSNEDKIYNISPLEYQKNTENQRKMTEKLLSTFKFVESTKPIDTSDQKTYRIEEEKFDMSSRFLFVENPSLPPRKAPHGSLPDTIHILDILKSNKPIVSIKTNILPEKRDFYKLFGDKIYFFSREDKMVEWIDFKDNIHKLTFTKVNDWTYSDDFIISPDDQKIIWVETKYKDNTMNNSSKLMLADLDGQNKKVLLEKKFYGEKYLKPIRWSNSGEEIYFTEQRGGLGGYIIFDGPANLSKINIGTGKIEYLFGDKGIVKDCSYIGDISSNEKYISYFNKDGDNPELIIRNMETGKENIFNIPLEEGFRGGGNAYFSPDGKHLAYNIAHWDPEDEYYRTIVANSIKEEQKIIVDDSQKAYEVVGWASNDKILLRNYIIDIDGSNLRKIEIVNP